MTGERIHLSSTLQDAGYTAQNASTWDRWVEEGIEWGKPIDHETYLKAQRGEWQVLLTPGTPVPREWFIPLNGARVLGLASGGGQQMPIFSACKARCTVLDNSLRQLESERMVAQREGYEIETVKGDMTKPLPFEDNAFDLIFHPVSNCYIEDVLPLWRECYRVLRPGGVLLAGVDNGLHYLFQHPEEGPLTLENPLPFNPLQNPVYMAQLMEDDAGVQFSHSLTEQIGGQLASGLRLTHLMEDCCAKGTCELCKYVPGFIMTRALKP
jgi:SAM-dependent methyltransferase